MEDILAYGMISYRALQNHIYYRPLLRFSIMIFLYIFLYDPQKAPIEYANT